MVLQDLAVEGGGVDLVKAEVRRQEVPALGELAAEGPERQIFHLVDRGVDTPPRCVGVAPFRGDGDLGRASLRPRSHSPRKASPFP